MDKKTIIIGVIVLAVAYFVLFTKKGKEVLPIQGKPVEPNAKNQNSGKIRIGTGQSIGETLSNVPAYEAKKIADLKKATFTNESVSQIKKIMYDRGLYTANNPNFNLNNHSEKEFLELFMTVIDKKLGLKRPNGFKNALNVTGVVLAAAAAVAATVVTAGAAAPAIIAVTAAAPALAGGINALKLGGSQSKMNKAYVDVLEQASVPSNLVQILDA